MKKILKNTAVVGALVMIISAVPVIGVSASTPYNWNMTRVYRQDIGTVSGLTSANDNAIDFYCNYYKSKSGKAYVKCDIQSNMKRIKDEKVYIDRYGDNGSISMKKGWYAKSNGGRCSVSFYLWDSDDNTVIKGTAR